MATRRTPIDPAASPKLILAGRVVTMDDRFSVIERGHVYCENGNIVAVQAADAPALAAFATAPLLETGSTIYPGLIDLHNHMPYNVLPLWQVPKKFSNRGQWARHAEYRTKVSAPMQVLAATDTLLAAICRYVETKSLLGGTTTGQGITLANQSGIRRYFRGVVRNVEATGDDELPEVSTRVPDVASRDVEAFLARLKREKTCYLLHLSEGLDDTAHRAFSALKMSADEWAITPSLCCIHAAALNASDFATLAEHGGSMVWSPFSNLLLYGGTADVAAAKAAGVPIALGPDWAPSGSRNLLAELKVAHLWSENNGGIFSARELVAMVTREAAKMLEWFPALGSLSAGKRADIICVEGTAGDAYLQLVRAKESDLTLVMINGVARAGKAKLMQAALPEVAMSAHERIQIAASARTMYFSHPNADPLSEQMSLSAARDELEQALRTLPAVARRAERRQPSSALMRVINPDKTWRLAIDEIVDAGVDLRPNLNMRDARGKSIKAAMMRPHAGASTVDTQSNERTSVSVSSMKIDALTVVEDENYFDALDTQRNLPDDIKLGLRALWE
jgi:5-methylthioadenosine/S-adenosylhomocysteine deaminase